MVREASAKYPLETGGILMGYWHAEDTIVATRYIGPGPRAIHKRATFSPDHEWQVGQVAEQYAASGRLDTYLGDWHTHPDERHPGFSGTDRQAIYQIASAVDARAPSALMVVMLGRPGEWQVSGCIGRVTRKCLMRRIYTLPVQIHLEDAPSSFVEGQQ